MVSSTELEKLKIDTVWARTPLTLIRTRGDADNINFENNWLKVFSPSEKVKPTPITMDVTQKIDLAVLTLAIPKNDVSGVDKFGFTIKGVITKFPRIEITCDSKNTNDSNVPTKHIIRCYIQCKDAGSGNNAMPWGFRDDIIWSYAKNSGPDADKYAELVQTPIELYAITPSLPFHYISNGVPIDLLRLFVLPSSTALFRPARDKPKQPIKGLDDWVKWVVQVCHASVADEECWTVDKSDRVHSFRYDVFQGVSRYTSMPIAVDDPTRTDMLKDRVVFFLDTWLDHLEERDSKGVWYTLNCYDQAAAVQAIVALGAPVDRIWWIYKQPFGYINQTDLVGWGAVSNPYFQAEPRKKKRSAVDVKQAFWNHAFCGYRNSANADVALDACAGPAAGDAIIPEYLKASIDDTDGISTKQYKAWNYPHAQIDALTYEHGTGVVGINNATDSAAAAAEAGNREFAAAAAFGPTGTFSDFTKYAMPAVTRKEINLESFLDMLGNRMSDVFKQQHPGQKTTCSIKRHTPRYAGAEKPGYLWWQAGVDLTASNSPKPFFSVLIRARESADKIVDEAYTYLHMMSVDKTAVFQTSASQDTVSTRRLGHMHMSAKEPQSLEIFLYANMMVVLEATDYKNGKDMAAIAEDWLSNATDEKELAPQSTTVSAPFDVKPNESFVVTVTSTRATKVTVMDASNWFRLTTTDIPSGQGTWKFKFTTLSLDDIKKGSKNLTTEESIYREKITFISVDEEKLGVPSFSDTRVRLNME